MQQAEIISLMLGGAADLRLLMEIESVEQLGIDYAVTRDVVLSSRGQGDQLVTPALKQEDSEYMANLTAKFIEEFIKSLA